MSFLVIILFVGLVWVGYITNHIPKEGRSASAKSHRITATITNSNRVADRASTLRAEYNGRKFKVKMKPTEAHLWVKGDDIDILLDENEKEYRILFNDYFRKNEERLRKVALEKLEKVEKYMVSGKIVKYEKSHYEMFEKSDFDSQRIFAFATYMRMVDIYTVIATLIGVAVAVWWKLAKPDFSSVIAGIAFVILLVWSLYSTVQTCKRTLKELNRKFNPEKE